MIEFFDKFMAVSWCVIYTIVLFNAKKYKSIELMPLTACMLIFPYEVAVVFHRFAAGYSFGFNTFVYMYFSVAEFLIMRNILRAVQRKKVITVVTIDAVLIFVNFYLVHFQNMGTFLAYFWTFSGMAVWLIYIIKNRRFYPVDSVTFALFSLKFIADTGIIYTYRNQVDKIVLFFVFLLPLIHLGFLVFWICEKHSRNHKNKSK